MNFLAHAYLSFNNPHILIGNLIADMVRGKQIDNYPQSVRNGIILHREIDAFTDNNPLVKQTKAVFSNSVGRYNASFLDVSFDHFLALDLLHEPSEGWLSFAENCYSIIEQNALVLPPQFCSMFMYMKSEDWLYNYCHRWMIERSFDRLKRRAKFLADDIDVFADFEKNYTIINDCYKEFFPQLEAHAKEFYTDLITPNQAVSPAE